MPSSILWAKNYYLSFLDHRRFKSLGCWKEKEERSIPIFENITTILDGHPVTREHAVEKCAVAAETFGYKVFALRNGGECASSENAADTYDVYGKSTKCSRDGRGGERANNVYQIIEGKCTVEFTDKTKIIFFFS